MTREDKYIIYKIAERAIKVVKPENTYSVARSVARKEIARANEQNTTSFTTSDATPFTQTITGFSENGVGLVTYSIIAGLPDASDGMYGKYTVAIRNEAGALTADDEQALFTLFTGTGLTGALVSTSTSGNDLVLEFTGIAATDIEGKFTWTIDYLELPGGIEE